MMSTQAVGWPLMAAPAAQRELDEHAVVVGPEVRQAAVRENREVVVHRDMIDGDAEPRQRRGQLTLSVRPRRESVSPLASSHSTKYGEYGVTLKSPATTSGSLDRGAARCELAQLLIARGGARRVVGALKCTPKTVNAPVGPCKRASIAGTPAERERLARFERQA